jgi:hypothetical protein
MFCNSMFQNVNSSASGGDVDESKRELHPSQMPSVWLVMSKKFIFRKAMDVPYHPQTAASMSLVICSCHSCLVAVYMCAAAANFMLLMWLSIGK